ncbi:hypothetical protein EJA72_22410 [Pseudomonas sp. PB120]|nr:hypothetical protein [Pseudomonas sp. PB120]
MTPSRAGSLPQWICVGHKSHSHHQSPVGASLLAMRPDHTHRKTLTHLAFDNRPKPAFND